MPAKLKIKQAKTIHIKTCLSSSTISKVKSKYVHKKCECVCVCVRYTQERKNMMRI